MLMYISADAHCCCDDASKRTRVRRLFLRYYSNPNSSKIQRKTETRSPGFSCRRKLASSHLFLKDLTSISWSSNLSAPASLRTDAPTSERLIGKGSLEMAAVSSGRVCAMMDPQREIPNGNATIVDRFKYLYPSVDEGKTPLPRSWSPKHKYTYIGLSQNNLRVHYKGKCPVFDGRQRASIPVVRV